MNRILNCALALALGFVTNCAQACELPAHPSASAIPVKIVLKDGTTVEGATNIQKFMVTGSKAGSFYYLLPEGSQVQMKVVWDPVCHNADTLKTEEYDGVVKENIGIDNKIGKINGYGFFPLTAMSEFFSLRGNRKDLSEAFSRETGIGKVDFVPAPSGTGPELLFSNMFTNAPTLQFNIVTTGTTKDGKEPAVPAELVSNASKIDGLNDKLPNSSRNQILYPNNEVFILESGKVTLQKKFEGSLLDDVNKVVYISGCGVSMAEMELELNQPTPDLYKAYINPTYSNKDKIHLTGIGYDPDAPDAAHGEIFTVNFTTPTINASSENSSLKVYVNSPPAGYKLNDVVWQWEETLYERVTSGEYDLAEGSEMPSPTSLITVEPETDTDTDTSSTTSTSTATSTETSTVKVDASVENIYVFKKINPTPVKYKAGLVIFYSKPQDGTGFAEYKIYDDCPPISSDLQITSSHEYSETDGGSDYSTKLNFKLDVLDSNPYMKDEFVETGREGISQKFENMHISFFYNYPIYNYKSEIVNLDSLGTKGFADLADVTGNTDSFKTYTHESEWFWKWEKDNEVQIDKLTSRRLTDDAGLAIGAVTTVEGSITIKNPKPWHEDGSEDSKKFAVYAMARDTAGHSPITSGSFTLYNHKMDSAYPNIVSVSNYALYPNESSVKEIESCNESVLTEELKSQVSWNANKWQAMNYLSVTDKTAPEIQVIVLDTRTNKYHVFGTSENVAAAYNRLENKSNDTSYDSLALSGSVPYINKNSRISSLYNYNRFDNVSELFTKYLQGANAVSTAFELTNKNGYVCQKNSRLIFYPRAFDNIGYNAVNAGVVDFKATLYDNSSNPPKDKVITDMNTGLEYVFRQENVDADNNVTPCYILKVEAKDIAGNKREFNLHIAVTGRTLDIRTLEEKRERIE